MSIVRIAKRSRYTVVDNTVVNDKALDFDTLGLLVYLLSKPDNWDVSITHLARQKKSGKAKISRLLKELQCQGYAQYKRLSSGQTEWTIFEKPQPDFKDGAKPQPEKPDVEKPDVENRPQVNTDKEVNTEKEEKKKSKKEKCDFSEVDQPESLNAQAWADWVDYRKAIKKPYKTEQGYTAAMDDLASINHEQQAECIRSSIANEYQGFFVKNFKGANNGSYTETTFEREEREHQEYLQQRGGFMGNHENEVPQTLGRTDGVKLL